MKDLANATFAAFLFVYIERDVLPLLCEEASMFSTTISVLIFAWEP